MLPKKQMIIVGYGRFISALTKHMGNVNKSDSGNSKVDKASNNVLIV
jgi:hypothetical protein